MRILPTNNRKNDVELPHKSRVCIRESFCQWTPIELCQLGLEDGCFFGYAQQVEPLLAQELGVSVIVVPLSTSNIRKTRRKTSFLYLFSHSRQACKKSWKHTCYDFIKLVNHGLWKNKIFILKLQWRRSPEWPSSRWTPGCDPPHRPWPHFNRLFIILEYLKYPST